MPFSITTKDGITINNIPDDVAPDSQQLRDRVAQIRAESESGGQQPTPPEAPPATPSAPDTPTQKEPGVIDNIVGGLETGLSIATGVIAEPLAGIVGLAESVNPLTEAGAGGRAVETVRNALTFQPRTDAGKAAIGAVSGAIEPVVSAISGAEEFLGQKTFEATGSPALAAAAETVPTVIGELLGISAARGATKVKGAARSAKEGRGIARAVEDAAPSSAQLRDVSRGIFKEIDDLGASVSSKPYRDLSNKIVDDAARLGVDQTVTPAAHAAVRRVADLVDGDAVALGDLENLRAVAQNAAASPNPREAAIGAGIIDNIDGFLDGAGAKAFDIPEGQAAGIGQRYKVARELWGRARRSELLDEAITKARSQDSGFENGIRRQFSALLRNKKTRKFFNSSEKSAIRKVIDGGRGTNIARTLGKFAFSDRTAGGFMGGSIGVAGGSAIGGTAGALIVPVVGLVSRRLAERLTKGGADFANQVIRAGKDANKITKAYLRHVPPAQRSPDELSQLLMRQDIDLDIPVVSAGRIYEDAASIARQSRAANTTGAGIATAAIPAINQQSQEQ